MSFDLKDVQPKSTSFEQEKLAKTSTTIQEENNKKNNITRDDFSDTPQEMLKASFQVDAKDVSNISDLADYEEHDANIGGDSLNLSRYDVSNQEDNNLSDKNHFSFWLLILLLVVVLGGIEAYFFITDLFNHGPILGLLGSVLIGLIFILTIVGIYNEFRYVFVFKRVDCNRLSYLQILNDNDNKKAFKLCEEMAKFANVYKGPNWNNFSTMIQDHYDAKSIFNLYSDHVLKPLDLKAREIIVKHSTEAAVVIALSPLAWFDMLIFLFRATRMIRLISENYGMRFGYWGRLKLYKRVIKNLIYIGATELAVDATVDILGTGMLSKLSGQLGQGVTAAIYSSRLGYVTVREIRPIPSNNDILSLSSLRKEVLTNKQLLGLINKKSQ